MSQLGMYTGVARDPLSPYNAAPPVDPTQTFYRSNLNRFPLDDRTDILATGVMTAAPLWLRAGDKITNLAFLSGATAGGTLTHWWFALYSSAATPALLAQTADQVAGAWAADTWKQLALAAPVTIAATGVYWAAVMVAATTPPSLIGCASAKALITGEATLAQASGSALTASAPATIASPSAQRGLPLVVAN